MKSYRQELWFEVLSRRGFVNIPRDVEAAIRAGREREAEGLMGAFKLNITALSWISLFVGGFLVYAATQASLVRRRAEFGLLRSLGATRGQVVTVLLSEVALLGVLAAHALASDILAREPETGGFC